MRERYPFYSAKPAVAVDVTSESDARLNLGVPFGPAERFVKRVLDLVGAVVGLVLLLPVLLVAAVAIKLDSPGPVLFRQERVGQCGRRFRILKLRTMVKDNDGSDHLAYVAALMRGEAKAEDGVFKLTADPRVTRVGRTLRKLSIDEIPQLINVLLGHMSLVGPRPPMAEEVRMYDDWAWQRLRVKPGLTGLWQVSGRCELGFRDMVELDLRYQEAWSPVLELRILLKTPAAVLSSRGAA
ncbi:MAG: sugar transferase [Actinobacteria bacterium]|nr:sugar transferase [Actinomycetota bacterium]